MAKAFIPHHALCVVLHLTLLLKTLRIFEPAIKLICLTLVSLRVRHHDPEISLPYQQLLIRLVTTVLYVIHLCHTMQEWCLHCLKAGR